MKINKLYLLILFSFFSLLHLSCDISSDPETVDGIIMSRSAHIIKAGESFALTARVTPGKAENKVIIWQSQDPQIATVSSFGLVTGISPGTTIITVTTQEGNFSATCIVTVLDPDND